MASRRCETTRRAITSTLSIRGSAGRACGSDSSSAPGDAWSSRAAKCCATRSARSNFFHGLLADPLIAVQPDAW